MYNIVRHVCLIAIARFKIHAVHVWMGTRFIRDNAYNVLRQVEFMVSVQDAAQEKAEQF